MKIAIISDIHGNMAYLAKAKEIIDSEKIKLVICCGDIQTEEVFHELDLWPQKVYLTLGNADLELEYKLKSGLIYPEKLKFYKDFSVLDLDKRKIAFTHYDFYAKKLATEGKYDLVFYGHTHTPWEEIIGKTIILNPGEIAAQFGKPTFAIYDLTQMKAKLVLLA
ncbi:MAG: YfcE family phosphodiesterase [Patescibacteria group bacterium]|nr:YfcE family phosphodiesterase [Patescibacteria group bacterium]